MEWEKADGGMERIHALSGVWDYEHIGMKLCLVWMGLARALHGVWEVTHYICMSRIPT
jgi:hypothetical protein